MEATKKKKAYLKPEITKFEMKTEGFIAGSNSIIIDDPTYGDDDNTTDSQIEILLSPSCTSGGQGLFLEPGQCNDDVSISKDLSTNINGGCLFWTDDILKKLGIDTTDKNQKHTKIRLCRLNETRFSVTNIGN